MAARKSAKTTKATAKTAKTAKTTDTVESKVVKLAEQLGWVLGTVRGKADGWIESDAVRQEIARIRDGAADLMEHVNRAGANAKQRAAGAINTAIDAAPGVSASARKAVASASASAKQMATSAGASAKKAVVTATKAAQKAAKSATAATPVVVTVKKRSGGTVDAPGKRHRKPPPQEKLDRRMGEPEGKHLGRKQFQPGVGGRRG